MCNRRVIRFSKGVLMRGRASRALISLILLVFVAEVDFSLAQASSSAQLNGTVLDSSGGTVGKASISLREVSTNQTHAVTSSDNGNYLVPNLPPGEYELKASFTGFAPYTRTGIVLRVGQTATVD